MKCLQNRKTGDLVRAPNEKAAEMVASGVWHYTSKPKFRAAYARMLKDRARKR